jgi:hypothetical protein
MKKGCSTRWLLLSGLGVILLMVVGLLALGSSPGTIQAPPAAGLLASEVTARQALAPATELAVQWQEDARLATVSSYQSAAGGASQRKSEWAFQFYSSSTQRLALITVTGDAAQVVRETLSPYAVSTFSAEAWHTDSDQALQMWWERGGGVLLSRRPDADLVMQLRISEDGERPVWTVSGFTVETESAFTIVVDAAEGTVVEQ